MKFLFQERPDQQHIMITTHQQNAPVLNSTAYLTFIADHVHPFMTRVYPFWTMHHVTKLKSAQTGNITMTLLYSNDLHSHRSQPNRAPLESGGMGD